MYAEHSVPIKEIKKLSVESIKTELAELEKAISQGKVTNIDLSTMVNDNIADLNYDDGFMSIKSERIYEGGSMSTTEQFGLPLKIELRAKTDKTDIGISYGNIIEVCFHHFRLRNKLWIRDIMNNNIQTYKKRGIVTPNEFISIELILGREMLIVKKNNEILHFGSDYEYIRKLKENPNFNLPSAISVGTCGGSTVTVESLQVTEI